MSDHSERSESEAGVSKDERVLSLSLSSSRWAASLDRGCADEEKVWSGMSAGLLVDGMEGILKVGGWLEQPDSRCRWAKANARHRTKAGTEGEGGQDRTVTLGNKREGVGTGSHAESLLQVPSAGAPGPACSGHSSSEAR